MPSQFFVGLNLVINPSVKGSAFPFKTSKSYVGGPTNGKSLEALTILGTEGSSENKEFINFNKDLAIAISNIVFKTPTIKIMNKMVSIFL